MLIPVNSIIPERTNVLIDKNFLLILVNYFDCLFSGDDYVDNPVWKEDAKKLEQVGACIHFFEYTKSTNSTKIKGLINQKLREE